MKNQTLAQDYLTRAGHRMAAVELLHERKSWADVVRESQELVELALKALLRASHIEVPRIHDVSEILLSQKSLFPKSIRQHLETLSEISRELRRDRELAFYGSEDLTPGEFYKKSDADRAKKSAAKVLELVTSAMQK